MIYKKLFNGRLATTNRYEQSYLYLTSLGEEQSGNVDGRHLDFGVQFIDISRRVNNFRSYKLFNVNILILCHQHNVSINNTKTKFGFFLKR